LSILVTRSKRLQQTITDSVRRRRWPPLEAGKLSGFPAPLG
jgi:hypothetical protein